MKSAATALFGALLIMLLAAVARGSVVATDTTPKGLAEQSLIFMPTVIEQSWAGLWTELGGSATGGGVSNSNGQVTFNPPSLAIGSDGLPIIAWADASSGKSEIYVRRWDGSSWVELGGSATGGGVSNSSGISVEGPSLAIGSDGLPILAWSDNSTGNSEIYVRRWDGGAWVELGGSATGGGISNNSGNSWWNSLAIGSDGMPVVAWSDDSSGDEFEWEVYVRRWDGAAWSELGGSATGGGISNSDKRAADPSVAVGLDGALIVAYQEFEVGDTESPIYVRQWDGNSWGELGDSPVVGDGGWPFLAIGRDGAPVLAWSDGSSGNTEVYVRRWDGTAWVELGGSASGGGVSNNGAGSFEPALAIGADGAPFVTWYGRRGDDREIYVRRWDGSAWTELDGSGTDDGISANGGRSSWPSIAIGPDGAPMVAWAQISNDFSTMEVYAKRWARP